MSLTHTQSMSELCCFDYLHTNETVINFSSWEWVFSLHNVLEASFSSWNALHTFAASILLKDKRPWLLFIVAQLCGLHILSQLSSGNEFLAEKTIFECVSSSVHPVRLHLVSGLAIIDLKSIDVEMSVRFLHKRAFSFLIN